jgi:hypothetical protein
MFGKEPELYYKGKSEKTSWIGRIFTIIFVVVYIGIIIYKVIRMFKRIDVTFFDTFIYEDKPPSIQLSNEIFYGGFALEDPNSYDAFIDEEIYYPKAYFKRTERKGDVFEWYVKELELERCKLEKFGSKYRDSFKKKSLNNYYCFKDMNLTLEGHFSYDLYSLFFIQFFPCVNTTESSKCKPIKEIDYYLQNTFINFEMQDIELTPKNYSHPVRGRDVDIYTTVGKKLFREIHVFFQIVRIETDLDFIGLDEYENIREEDYLKYDEMVIMSNFLETDIYEKGDSFCDVTIKLSDNVRIERRVYTKLITILGDVGGLMEVIFTLFRILCSFSVDILYDISLVNNIFSFDLEKKLVLNKKKERKEDIKDDDDVPKRLKFPNSNKYISRNKFSSNDMLTVIEETGSGNRIKEIEKGRQGDEGGDEIKTYKLNLNENPPEIIKKENNQRNINIFLNNYQNKRNISRRLSKISLRNKRKRNSINDVVMKDGNNNTPKIIDKIKINRACIYCCFLCVRRRKNMENILLDEGINIICERLDVINLFHKIYRIENMEYIQNKFREKNIYSPISNESKTKLLSLYNK